MCDYLDSTPYLELCYLQVHDTRRYSVAISARVVAVTPASPHLFLGASALSHLLSCGFYSRPASPPSLPLKDNLSLSLLSSIPIRILPFFSSFAALALLPSLPHPPPSSFLPPARVLSYSPPASFPTFLFVHPPFAPPSIPPSAAFSSHHFLFRRYSRLLLSSSLLALSNSVSPLFPVSSFRRRFLLFRAESLTGSMDSNAIHLPPSLVPQNRPRVLSLAMAAATETRENVGVEEGLSEAFSRTNLNEHQQPENRPKTDEEYAQSVLTLRAIVSSREAGVIIGKAGKNVADLREEAGVKAAVSKMVQGVHDRVLTVTGGLQGCARAYALVAKGLMEGAPQTGVGGVGHNGTHRMIPIEQARTGMKM